MNVAGAVTHIFLIVKGTSQNYEIQRIKIDKVMGLVKAAVHGSDTFVGAVQHCLVRIVRPAPTDKEWEKELQKIYFKIVKPYVVGLIENSLWLTSARFKALYDDGIPELSIRRDTAYA